MTTQDRPPARSIAPTNARRMTLDAIRRGPRPAPDRILLVGVEGVGKSTFAAGAPAPVFLPTEDGIGQLDVASFPTPKTYKDALDVVETLTTSDHEFKTLALDTLDAMEPLVVEAVCQRNGWQNIESPGFGKGWVAVTAEWRVFLLALDRLREAKGMEIILLAHSTLRNVVNPSGSDYARFEGSLNKGALALVKGWTDVNLFAIHEEFVGKDRGEAKAKVKTSGRRIMHTQRGAGWDAKSRHSLPPVLALDYSEYAAAREAGRVAAPEKLDAEARELLAAWAPDADVATKFTARLDAVRGDSASLAKAVDFLRTKVAEKEGA